MQHILIIDDSKEMQKLLESNLTARNFKVTDVFSGNEALKTLEKSHFDLILLDIRLPDMSGLEVLKSPAISKKNLNTPVFIITASNTPEEEMAARSLGADKYITKPFQLHAFIQLIKQTLYKTNVNTSSHKNPAKEIKIS